MNHGSKHRQPRYLQQTGAPHDRWIVSYADVVTVLLILFIAIAAQTSRGTSTGASRGASKGPPPTVPKPPAAPAPPPESARHPERQPPEQQPPEPTLSSAQAALEKHGVTPKLDRRGLVITLPQAVLFSAGDDSIRADALPVIEQIASVLSDMDNNIMLVGHADPTPVRGRNFRNNWDLSAARSIRLLEVLTHRFGLAESRFTVASEGSNSPLGSNEDANGRAQNRRVEIVILDEPRTPIL